MTKDMTINKPWVFYLLSFTWGILVSLAGCIVTLALLITGHKPQKDKFGWLFVIGESWGGVSIGPCRMISKTSYGHYLLCHEFGHSIQNCFYGPFMIFIVCIPSVIRFWYYTFKYLRKNETPPRAYDSIWFESQATRIGYKNYDFSDDSRENP